MLCRRIAAHQAPPTCLPELWRALLDEWCNIPQDQIDNLIVCLGVHRTARLQWCRASQFEQDICVLFSDESSFILSSDCRRQLWRESGTAYRPENIQEKDRYPTCSWAGIDQWPHAPTCGCELYDGPTIVLLPHVRIFCGAVGDKMDDNATCHRTLAVQDC
ncbi:hypothetical protein TNCV_184881 [Trichonephila clavipes]|nr:hypothetical protein TNCV_184881 [Trichonephila clavipes]